MREPAERRPPSPARAWWVEALHIFALSGFAIAQPLFDVLRRNPTFFIAHGADPRSVVLFAVALILVPPALAVALIGIVRVVSARAARVLHVVVVGVLVGLAAMPYLGSLGLGSLASLIVFALIAVVASIAYVRVRFIGRYATMLAVAPILLVVLFLSSSPVRPLIATSGSQQRPADAASNLPVVMLLMDEFSQGSILTPSGKIDAKRFPNFARLAERSTWYPNATSNANATHVAFPAIVTGRLPRPPIAAPTHASYPDNMFSLVGRTHDTTIDEWVTALCPVSTCRTRATTYSAEHLGADTALIYLHVVLPPRLKAALPPLGHQWAGFFANPTDNEQRLPQVPRPARPLVRTVMRWLDDDTFRMREVQRFRTFLGSIGAGDEPTFSFLHLGLPHQPWHLLPDARPYNRQDTPGLDRSRLVWADEARGEAGFQRYLLQVKALDGLLGELIDRLDDQRAWDRSLIVAMADHGVTFQPAHAVRTVVTSEGDLLPVPLFVKYPKQRRSEVDRRNAELIDVFPTIADVLDIDVPWQMDGSSLAGRDPKRTDKRVWAAGRPLPPYDLDVTFSKTDPSQRIRDLFGKARRRDDLFAFGPHRELIGRRVSGLPVEDAPAAIDAVVEDAWRWRSFDPQTPLVPARPSGTLRAERAPPWIAVAVNGKVAGFGRPWQDGGRWLFSVMVSDRYLERGRNELRLLGIEDDGRLYEIVSRP